MKKFAMISLTFTTLATTAAMAAPNLNCQINRFSQFTAYSNTNMILSRSDFQGLVGAGNSISASHFRFGPLSENNCKKIAVSVANSFRGSSGAMDGHLEITNPDGYADIAESRGYPTFSIPRVQNSQLVDHVEIQKQIKNHSRFLSQLPSSTDTQVFKKPTQLTINLGQSKIQVVHLDKSQVGTEKNIIINGKPYQTVVINISGQDISFNRFQLTINGVLVNNIFWNFHQAKNLIISTIGGTNTTYQAPFDGYDTSLGLQGYVLAPQANVTFRNTKITGSLFVNNLETGAGPTGQINTSPKTPPSPCVVTHHPECQVTPVKPEQPLN